MAKIDLSFLESQCIAVLGLGKSGLSTARALKAAGADVWAWDDNESARATAEASEIPLVDLTKVDWSLPAALLLSPGIPHDFPSPHPVAALAKQAGCPLFGDVELLARAQKEASFVGITGTNGKSTTTALIAHILEGAGRPIAVGGNLGTPVLDLPALGSGGIYVLELSSYQLELTESLACDVALLLNISADHLDRHGGMAGYVAAKRRIFGSQKHGQIAVVGCDDDISREIHDQLLSEGSQRVIAISGSDKLTRGVSAKDGLLWDALEGEGRAVLDLKICPALPGTHNWQNAAAAYAACKAIGLQEGEIAGGLKSYPGLAHRQEIVGTLEGVLFVNDSKATNADAAARALSCYGTIYWIAGGRAKEGGIESLAPYHAHIRHAFLIGEAEAGFAEALQGRVPVTRCGTLDKAVAEAFKLARDERRPEAVVLLSPACASFDQYRNFEVRGDAFRAAVAALAEKHGHALLPATQKPAVSHPAFAGMDAKSPVSGTDMGKGGCA
jgi:UDP-N-acetylmuramoylalanine--D-glutamate ligase